MGPPPEEVAAGSDGRLSEPVLLVSRMTKPGVYYIYDQNGELIGGVQLIGPKVTSGFPSFHHLLKYRLQIAEFIPLPSAPHVVGIPVLFIVKPARWPKSRFLLQDRTRQPLGEIVQEKVFGRLRFGLHGPSGRVGSIEGSYKHFGLFIDRTVDGPDGRVRRLDDSHPWGGEVFSIRDERDNEIARMTQTSLGEDPVSYAVQTHQQLEEPLRSFVIAAAPSVDMAMGGAQNRND